MKQIAVETCVDKEESLLLHGKCSKALELIPLCYTVARYFRQKPIARNNQEVMVASFEKFIVS